MAHSQLQKANESDKTSDQEFPSIEKIGFTPWHTMHNAKCGTPKKGSFNDERHIDSKGNTTNNTKQHS